MAIQIPALYLAILCVLMLFLPAWVLAKLFTKWINKHLSEIIINTHALPFTLTCLIWTGFLIAFRLAIKVFGVDSLPYVFYVSFFLFTAFYVANYTIPPDDTCK